jgi:hypothetical protein
MDVSTSKVPDAVVDGLCREHVSGRERSREDPAAHRAIPGLGWPRGWLDRISLPRRVNEARGG